MNIPTNELIDIAITCFLPFGHFSKRSKNLYMKNDAQLWRTNTKVHEPDSTNSTSNNTKKSGITIANR